MLKILFNKIKNFKIFVGERTWRYFIYSIFTGVTWFLIESAFVFILQGFLCSIGLLSRQLSMLPDWYPISPGESTLILIFFGIFRSIAYGAKLYLTSVSSIAFATKQRQELLRTGLRNPKSISTSELLATFSEIVNQSSSVISYFTVLFNIAVSAGLFFILGFVFAPIEMLVGCILLGAFLYPIKYLTKNITEFGGSILSEWENVNRELISGLKNNFLLKVYNQVERVINRGSESLSGYQRHFNAYSKYMALASAMPLLIGITILSIITFVSVKFIHTQPSKLISFFYIFIRLALAASETNSTFSTLKLNFHGLKRLYHLSFLSNHISEKQKQMVIPSDSDITIEAKNISFQYKSDLKLIESLSFHISKSDVLVIKGESGSGKSTLLSLILGIQKPDSGVLKINQINTCESLAALHKVLGYVGPEPFLISGSIKENLLYAHEEVSQVSEDEIWKALEIVDLKDLVLNTKNRLNEKIGDIPQFSTGQQQRLSFARAILRKPKLLVLDEATANLDVQTEDRVLLNLRKILESCTTIIVTHKNTFDNLGTKFLNLSRPPGH